MATFWFVTDIISINVLHSGLNSALQFSLKGWFEWVGIPITLLPSARERCCAYLFFSPHLNCTKDDYLCLSEESWEQKWVMLGISASIFDKGITPHNLLGQFMSIMSRDDLLCSLIIASWQQFLWTMHRFTLLVPTQYTCYSAFTAGSSKSIKTTCQNPPLVWIQRTILKIVARQMEFLDEVLWNHCSSITTE